MELIGIIAVLNHSKRDPNCDWDVDNVVETPRWGVPGANLHYAESLRGIEKTNSTRLHLLHFLSKSLHFFGMQEGLLQTFILQGISYMIND